jgi:aryl-alcohol dehydrogenase
VSSTTITAAVVERRAGPFELEQLQLAEPRADELLVEVVASGVCHADLVARDQLYPVPLPAVLGHEGAGVVVATGDAVRGFAVGDSVLMSFSACHSCRTCLAGRPAYCLDGFRHNFGGQRPDGSSAYSRGGERVHGHFFGQSSFATHSLVNQRDAVRLPAGAPLDVLAPLGCGVQTGFGAIVNSLAVPAGARVAVFGAGSVGLSAVIGAQVAGAAAIVAVDVNRARLDLARELGATETLDAAAEDDLAAAVREACGGELEYAVETSGRPEVVRAAVDALAIGGVAGLVGVSSIAGEVAFAQTDLVHGKTVRGILEGDSVPQLFLPRLVELHARGELPLERFLEPVPFAEIEQAVRAAEAGEIVKPVLQIGPQMASKKETKETGNARGSIPG